MNECVERRKGVYRGSNPGPPAPKTGIMPLDHRPDPHHRSPSSLNTNHSQRPHPQTLSRSYQHFFIILYPSKYCPIPLPTQNPSFNHPHITLHCCIPSARTRDPHSQLVDKTISSETHPIPIYGSYLRSSEYSLRWSTFWKRNTITATSSSTLPNNIICTHFQTDFPLLSELCDSKF